EIRFVGGGCPGNAQAVSRLLRERPVKEVVALIKDIPCRNDTSCLDQLVKALLAASHGTPVRSTGHSFQPGQEMGSLAYWRGGFYQSGACCQ
ncbi:MAG: TSCPD domain-containing protein, partial [Desulfobacteraceae bacterium]|nr:TSCPD domain-containing protein [Desulfobacteraceae bacterium]